LLLKNTFALVRLRTNLILYEQPKSRQPRKKGVSCKYGPRFNLSSRPRLADRTETFQLRSQENARELIERLLNMEEQLSGDLRDVRAETQRYRAEVNRLKGGQGQPKVKG
jgi:hypothetical protein